MAKARIYGQKTTYIPNNKPDMRYIKKLHQSKKWQPVELGVKAAERKKRV